MIPSSYPVYPDGRGHFALGNPDGQVLRQNMPILLVLAGQQIAGTIRWSERGDFFEAADDRSICGLYPAMRMARPRKQYRPRFHWTTSRQALLIERYLDLSFTRQAKRNGLYAIGRCIAQEQHWPISVTCSRLYLLREELELRRQALVRQRQAAELSQQQQAMPPIVLKQDIFVWTVLVGSRQTRQNWLLPYAAGACPLLPGQHCIYVDQLYRVERVWTSQLDVSYLGPAPVQAQHDEDERVEQAEMLKEEAIC